MELRRSGVPIRGCKGGGRAAFVAGIALATLLAGCRALVVEQAPPNVGDVSAALVPPPAGATHLELASSQRFVYPDLDGPVAMPVYPPGLLPLRLSPVQVCVEVDIDEAGAVFAARARQDGACPLPDDGAAHLPVFSEAALAAVRRWRYAPAYVCQAPDGFDGEDPCLADGMVEHPTRLRLSYAFRFSQHDGAPSVERAD